jgi:hypothetical protein
MFINKPTLILILFSLLLISCKEKIDLDVPGGIPKLIVEAEVTTETDSSYVKLTKTTDYYSTTPIPVVTNATVTVNNIVFNYTGNGIYKAPSPYTGVAGQTYQLKITADGNTYTSSSTLEKMFRVDSVFQVYKPKSGFIPAGWSINYIGFDDRPKIKYTYFKLGYFDTIVQRDSFSSDKILFNSDQTPVGVPYSFELPFTRFPVGGECLMIFRSIDKFMNDFIMAYMDQTSGAPGPFQTPPANLPTNITGGAIGYFATYDVVRRRYTVK